MKNGSIATIAIAVGAISACARSDVRPDDTVAVVRQGYVDSAMTIEEGLRRFRDGIPPVSELAGGAPHRDTLIVRFVSAVEQGDIDALRSMVLNRAEFAYLYYPSSPYTRHPTRQLPALAWFLILENSQKGVNRVYDRYAHKPLGYVGHRCAPEPRDADAFRFWDDCVLSLRDESGSIIPRRLFGSIIELNGQYKFFSYNNDL